MKDPRSTTDSGNTLDERLAHLPGEAAPSPLVRESLMRQLPFTEQVTASPIAQWQRVTIRVIAAGILFAAGLAVGRNSATGRGSAHVAAEMTPAVSVQRAGTQYVATIARWNSTGKEVPGRPSDVTEVAVATIAAAAVEVASKAPGDTLLARLAEVASGAREQLGNRSAR